MPCVFSSSYSSSATITRIWSWTHMCKNEFLMIFMPCIYKSLICYIKVTVLLTIPVFHYPLLFWHVWNYSLIHSLLSSVRVFPWHQRALDQSCQFLKTKTLPFEFISAWFTSVVLSKRGEFAGSGTACCEFITVLSCTVETLLRSWFYEYNE